MDFFERYETLCNQRGIEPCSQKTADRLNTTRSNISYWKKGTKPNVDRLRDAADMLQTSSDFLLGRTDDPTDYSVIHDTVSVIPPEIASMLSRLDAADIERVSIYMHGLLDGGKYQKSSGLNGEAI